MKKNIRNKLDWTLIDNWPGKIALIAAMVLLAYFQTLGMYFWNDDNAVLFKLQHLNEGVGNLGSGIFGFDSPYRMVIFPLIPVFYIFKLNPAAFFTYGIFFYFLASLSVYFLAKSIFRNEKHALLASLIFASGLIGAESIWRVYNSVHTSITIIYIILFSTFYIYSTYEKKLSRILLFYSLALFFYILAIQWGFVRAHGIILIAIGIELLFNFSWRFSIFRITPFFYLFYKWYATSQQGSHHLNTLYSEVINNYNFGLLLIPLKTLSNIFIPDIFNVPLLLFLILLLLVIFKLKSRILFFGLIFTVSSYITYFVIYHDTSLNTTHRYLTTASPGLSIILVYIFSKIFTSEKKVLLACAVYIILNLVILNWIHFNILKNRSFATRNFYQTLTTEVKKLNKNSVLYFDVEDSLISKKQFEDFFGVGSMPNETAIAIYYDLDRYDVYLPHDFNDLVDYSIKNNVNPENIYSFFYGSDSGLINTTPILKQNLFGDRISLPINNFEDMNLASSSPFTISLTLNPKIETSRLTLKDNNSAATPEQISYLSSKLDYYKNVEATSSSDWKHQEIKYISDNNLDTSWMSHRVHWHYKSYDQVIIDLKSLKKISAVKLVFGPTDKSPTKYQYSCSKGDNTWQVMNIFYHNPRNHGEEKLDKFPEIECLNLKLELFDTPNKDAPVIRELEVIESRFSRLDFKKIKKIEENPYDFISKENYSFFYDYFTSNGIPVNLCLTTNKSNTPHCEQIRVKLDTKDTYTINLPPTGTTLKKVEVDSPQSLQLNISNKFFKYRTWEDITI